VVIDIPFFAELAQSGQGVGLSFEGGMTEGQVLVLDSLVVAYFKFNQFDIFFALNDLTFS